MMIRTIDGKYIDLDAIEDSRLPPDELNYKQTTNEFFGRDRPTKPKQDKKYNYFNIKKQLENEGLTLVKNIIYKGDRYGQNTYRVIDGNGNKLIGGYLYEIATWIKERK